MSFLAMDWGGPAGKFYECWKCEPCCGEPCNVKDGAMCFLCWCCCGLCSMSKLYSYSVDQDCKCVNHVLMACFCGPCTNLLVRHNLRLKAGVGEDDGMHWLGDFLCCCFCGCCAGCQYLRSVPRESWDWIGGGIKGGNFGATAESCKFTYGS